MVADRLRPNTKGDLRRLVKKLTTVPPSSVSVGVLLPLLEGEALESELEPDLLLSLSLWWCFSVAPVYDVVLRDVNECGDGIISCAGECDSEWMHTVCVCLLVGTRDEGCNGGKGWICRMDQKQTAEQKAHLDRPHFN